MKLLLLRYKARKYYKQYFDIADQFSCGGTLLEEISSGAYRAKRNFNATMDKIAKLDPDCPKGRL